MNELANELKELILKYPTNFSRVLKTTKRDLLERIIQSTPLLNEKHSLSTRIYWVLNDLNDFPLCQNPECGKKLYDKNVIWKSKGVVEYPSACCASCSKKTPAYIAKFEATCLARYGVKNPNMLPEIKIKKEQTFLRKYGVKLNWQKPEIAEKAIKSSHSNEAKEKRKQTNIDRYGCENPMQNNQILLKVRQTRFERYGGYEDQKTREKREATIMDLYGVKNYNQSEISHIYRRSRYLYENIYFDSLPEVAFFIFHKENGANIKRSSKVFSYFVNGNEHKYFPDFELNGELIEIKGDHFFDESGHLINPYDKSQNDVCLAKEKCMIENKVNIIKSSEILPLVKLLKQKNGANFFENMRLVF